MVSDSKAEGWAQVGLADHGSGGEINGDQDAAGTPGFRRACARHRHVPQEAAHGFNIEAAIPILPVNHGRPHPAAGGGERLLVDGVDTGQARRVKQPAGGGTETGEVVAGHLGEVVRVDRSSDGWGVGPPGEELLRAEHGRLPPGQYLLMLPGRRTGPAGPLPASRLYDRKPLMTSARRRHATDLTDAERQLLAR